MKNYALILVLLTSTPACLSMEGLHQRNRPPEKPNMDRGGVVATLKNASKEIDPSDCIVGCLIPTIAAIGFLFGK